MAEVARKIPAVLSSPTSLAYIKHAKRDKAFYIPAFKLTKEQWSQTLLQPWLKNTDPLMPPYPYPTHSHFPEANYGLYGGGKIESGNKISKGRNKGKTLRHWFPNIRFEHLRSEALDRILHIPVRARVMRTIRKCGGLDEYLLGDKPGRIKELGLLGWKLRYLVLKSPSMQQRFQQEHAMLGQSDYQDPLHETFADVWNNEKKRAALIKQQDEAWEKLTTTFDRAMEHMNRQWSLKETAKGEWEVGLKDLDKFVSEESYKNNTLHRRRPSSMALPELVEEEVAKTDAKGRPLTRKQREDQQKLFVGTTEVLEALSLEDPVPGSNGEPVLQI